MSSVSKLEFPHFGLAESLDPKLLNLPMALAITAERILSSPSSCHRKFQPCMGRVTTRTFILADRGVRVAWHERLQGISFVSNYRRPNMWIDMIFLCWHWVDRAVWRTMLTAERYAVGQLKRDLRSKR